MKFVAFSDSHGAHHKVSLPPGDVLLFSGDLCSSGRLEEVEKFGRFLAELPHRHKIVIAGNHDWPFQREPEKAREALGDVIYLEDEAVEIDGVHIYGSPWQPRFCNWAFNLPRGEVLAEVWSRIPEKTDVLLTHGPPMGILDRTYDGRHVGCADLMERVSSLPHLKAHVFGHIHEAYGTYEHRGCHYYNASAVDLRLRPGKQSPWSFEINK